MRPSLDSLAPTLLPTPRASDTGTPGRRASDGFRPPLSQALLLTPTAMDSQGSRNHTAGRKPDSKHHDGTTLTDAMRLLPTPAAVAHARNATANRTDPKPSTNTKGHTLADVFWTGPDAARWGQFASAVARWERITDRPAPDPTEPSPKDGKPRLSPAFVEWMMGAPDGWVCDVAGLSRNEKLRILGNGVVWQQGAHGLRILIPAWLASIPSERAA